MVYYREQYKTKPICCLIATICLTSVAFIGKQQTQPAVWSGEACNAAWGPKWLRLTDLFCNDVPSPAKDWHRATNLLWLASQRGAGLSWRWRITWYGKTRPRWEDCRCHFRIAFQSLSKIWLVTHQVSSFSSFFLLCLLRPVSPSMHVAIRHIGDLLSRWFICAGVTASSLWFPPTLFCTLVFMFYHLSSSSFVCLCSPGYFFVLTLLWVLLSVSPQSLWVFPPPPHTAHLLSIAGHGLYKCACFDLSAMSHLV